MPILEDSKPNLEGWQPYHCLIKVSAWFHTPKQGEDNWNGLDDVRAVNSVIVLHSMNEIS